MIGKRRDKKGFASSRRRRRRRRLTRAPASTKHKTKQTAVFVAGPAAAKLWDAFYRRNAASFFRDRHYLEREWPDLGRALAAADARAAAALAAAAAAAAAAAPSPPALAPPGPLTLLEAGCGAGNAILPLLEAHPLPGAVCAYACDFSPAGVDLVRRSAVGRAATRRGALTLWVADVAGGGGRESDGRESDGRESDGDGDGNPLVGPGRAPAGGCDYATLVFVLSALDPPRGVRALRNVAHALRPGTGRLLLRDYASGDLAQSRLSGGWAEGGGGAVAAETGDGEGRLRRPGGAATSTAAAAPAVAATAAAAGNGGEQRLGGRLYVRGDGTCAYYFEPEELVEMARCAGLRVAPRGDEGGEGGSGGGVGAQREVAACGVEIVTRTVVNRASGAVMQRRWLQAAFYRPLEEEAEERQGSGGGGKGEAAGSVGAGPAAAAASAAAAAVAAPCPKQPREGDDAKGRPAVDVAAAAAAAASAAAASSAAALALARMRAPFCFRPLAGASAPPPAPEFRTLSLPAAPPAAPGLGTPPSPLRWLAPKHVLPAGSAFAGRLQGWAAEVASALASSQARRRAGGGAASAAAAASVVVVPWPGDAPSHVAAALLALHAVRAGSGAARRAACAVLSASAAAPAWASAGGGEEDGDDGEEDPRQPRREQQAEEEEGRLEQQLQVVALRAYRLTLAANAPRAVFERVATWRLVLPPAAALAPRGAPPGREAPEGEGDAETAAAGRRCGGWPFDVAIVLPPGGGGGGAAARQRQRQQQRRLVALAAAAPPGRERRGDDGGGGGGGAPMMCLLDFTVAAAAALS